MKKRNIKSFIVVIKKKNDGCDNGLIKNIMHSNEFNVIESNDNTFQLFYRLRTGKNDNKINEFENNIFIFGDDSEYYENEKEMNGGTYGSIEVNTNTNVLKAYASIIGLPPIFIWENKKYIALTSDLFLFNMFDFIPMKYDITALSEFCQIGYPVYGKTLFSNIRLLKSGIKIEKDKSGMITYDTNWRLQKNKNIDSIIKYNEIQSEAFRSAIRSLNIEDSFLSLTAGLDTRAILAVLLDYNKSISTCTLTGVPFSLDSKSALELSMIYGLSHKKIVLDEKFIKNLPGYITLASKLTGGLSSIDQAHEIFLYENLNNQFKRRVSGNLGNQIGRMGVEKISLRNANIDLLNPDLINSINRRKQPEWFSVRKNTSIALSHLFLIQEEVPYSSVANFSIGNYYAIQQTPYAHKKILNNLCYAPTDISRNEKISTKKMRLRDLKHRFLGHSKEDSFQVKIISEIGGFVSSYPINWGWRAKGGISLNGFFNGMLAFSDAYISSKYEYSSKVFHLSKMLGINGKHDYVRTSQWINEHLKDFIYDTLNNKEIRESNLFNTRKLDEMLTEHYNMNRYDYKNLIFAIDLALSTTNFNASL